MKVLNKLLIAVAISGLVATTGSANDLVAKGAKIFKTKKLGNCVACHDVNGKADIQAMGPGTLGPKLQALSFWTDEMLYNTIYDIYAERKKGVNPMPAFGKNGWLDDAEIKALVAYLKTVN